MDEQINDKIRQTLADPQSLKTIASLVSALSAKQEPDAHEAESDSQQLTEISEKIPSEVISAMSGLQKASSQKDDRVNLLLSIKPFLNNRKQQRVDSLIKALGAVSLINAYKDSDIFGSPGLK